MSRPPKELHKAVRENIIKAQALIDKAIRGIDKYYEIMSETRDVFHPTIRPARVVFAFVNVLMAKSSLHEANAELIQVYKGVGILVWLQWKHYYEPMVDAVKKTIHIFLEHCKLIEEYDDDVMNNRDPCFPMPTE